MGKSRDRPSAPGGLVPKRSSGAAGALQDVATPTGSTQAQFQNSSNNLPQRMTAQPGMNAQVQNGRNQEPQPTGFQKLMKTLCCG
jgi:casein kinase 1